MAVDDVSESKEALKENVSVLDESVLVVSSNVNFKDMASNKVSSNKRTSESEKDKAEAFGPSKEMKSHADQHHETAHPLARLYLGTRLIYDYCSDPSMYKISCRRMDYIVHLINDVLVDNFYFKRSCPSYHPYVFRLYCGIIFLIQVLRAGHTADTLTAEQLGFLLSFLKTHPLETLPVPAPLLVLFKTICASSSELPTHGKVVPILPQHIGPNLRSDFIVDHFENHFIPNIPGIFALLENLHSLTVNPTTNLMIFPTKEAHTPVNAEAVVFGHHAFPAVADRTPRESWSLVSPGLQYPCEADRRSNEDFAERYKSFKFPVTGANDNLSTYEGFTHNAHQSPWFNSVIKVAAVVASYCNKSGTLADCSPEGQSFNQICVVLQPSETEPSTPRHNADQDSMPSMDFYLETHLKRLPQLAEATSCTAQTHIRYYPDHPFYEDFGFKQPADGPVWKFRPLTTTDIESHQDEAIDSIVQGAIRDRMIS